MISTTLPNYCTSSYSLTEEEVIQLLANIEEQVKSIALHMFLTGYSKGIPEDDLKQEAMMKIWEIAPNYDLSVIKNYEAYSVKKARYIMLDYIKDNSMSSISLEEYLTVNTERGTKQRELPDMYTPPRKTPRKKRRLILMAMEKLTQKERSVIMAEYRIDDRRGPCPTMEEVKQKLKLSQKAYYSLRYRAMRKITKLVL